MGGVRKRAGAALSVALALVVAGSGVATNAAHAQQFAAQHATAPAGDASLLPASTALYLSYNPTIGGVQGAYLRQLESAFPKSAGLSTLGVSNTACIDTNKQILSWIGGSATLAITDPKVLSSSSSASQGLAILIALKPGSTVSSILTGHKLGKATLVTSYAGVPYYTIQLTACNAKPDKTPTYGAIIGNEAMIAGSVKDLQKLIDVAHGKAPALSSTASYKRLVAALPPTGIGYMYFDTPTLVTAGSGTALSTLGNVNPLAGGSTAKPAPSSTGQIAKNFGPGGIMVATQSNGISVKAAQLMNVAGAPGTGSATPNKAATILPANTMFYTSFANFKALLNSGIGLVKSTSPSDAKTFDQLTAAFGSVIDLLDGEFAIGVTPLTPTDASKAAAGDIGSVPLVALVDVAKHPEASATITTLLGAMGSGTPALTFKPGKSKHGSAVYANKAGYGYAFVKNWVVISSSIAKAVSSIEGILYDGKPSLAGAKNYLDAGSTLPKRASGVLFLDITAVRELTEGLTLPTMSAKDKAQYLKTTQPSLMPLHALEASTSTLDGGKTILVNALLTIAH